MLSETSSGSSPDCRLIAEVYTIAKSVCSSEAPRKSLGGVWDASRKCLRSVWRAELDEEVECLVDDVVWAGRGLVDLVDHDEDAMPHLERLVMNSWLVSIH